MKSRRIFWVVPTVAILLAAAAAVAASLWVGRFLRSETFREWIGAETGEALARQLTKVK